ncbi:MAG TPA: hypothetical protein VNF49_01025 [Candidatus Binataceae bacterium]|nr:hypothetical protein [Candidatus Binataceae bacterium]
MMTLQGIDLAGGWWHGLEDMVFSAVGKCLLCNRSATCRSWREQDRPALEYLAFCPISEFIEACRILDPMATPLEVQKPDSQSS